MHDATEEGVGEMLCTAVSLGNMNLVTDLLDAKADVNSQSFDGKTALHVAVKMRNEEMVRFLILEGASAKIVRLISTPTMPPLTL